MSTETDKTPDSTDAEKVFDAQRRHRWITKTSTVEERIRHLTRLRAAITDHLDEIRAALHADLLRPPRPRVPVEVAAVLADIDDAGAHLAEWTAPTPLTPPPYLGAGAEEFVQYEARGVCLLFAPWNFPFGLLFQPLVPIIAAGNTAIVKPNELAPATSTVSARIIREVFAPEHVAVFTGGVELANALLELPVDHIFFTGSPAVGRVVMAGAARHLASVTLELGGKCPAIVDGTTDLATAATQIAQAKHTNAGQICLSPDYLLIHQEARDEFLGHYLAWVEKNLYPDGKLAPGALGKIIDRRNLDRLTGYLDDAVARGARLVDNGVPDPDGHILPPAVLLDVPADARILTEEIFGPILPVLTFTDQAQIVEHVRAGGKPLAIYVYSDDRDLVDAVLAGTSSGGVTVNGWALHFADSQLPFGGVGSSGMGRYHGVHGFRELSHARSVFLAAAPPAGGTAV
ncbi:aldehyde dehydrogenase family protein [Frankia tisae]|uniref:aldehyde dehydrogenase family protein n=1 Tax=Frankia tisae TaxID=2950104 RepID=UPI0021C18F68|nr:aldehyde dehydrogenase family protein [Frankia tisae]